jgi:hypothetical protein
VALFRVQSGVEPKYQTFRYFGDIFGLDQVDIELEFELEFELEIDVECELEFEI